jgi:hypothetical protein
MKTMNLSERPQDGRTRTRIKANTEEKRTRPSKRKEENTPGPFSPGASAHFLTVDIGSLLARWYYPGGESRHESLTLIR